MQATGLSTVIPLFKTNKALFFKSLEGVSMEHLRQRPNDKSNPMIWIAGHLVFSRTGLVRIVGGKVDEKPWNALFGRGASVDEILTYPDSEEIAEQWKIVSDVLMTRLHELTEDELDQPSSFNVPAGEQTVRGAVAFLNFHETYHIGQLAYLRKLFGYSQLAG